METKEIDGVEYVKRTDVENIIKQRVEKVAVRATEAENKAKDLQSQLEKASKADSTIDILTQQLEQMKHDLSNSEQKFTRYQAISKHGLTDPDIIDAIEWSYERSQNGRGKKERINLSEWLDTVVSDPEQAPSVLRPHLRNIQPEPAEKVEQSEEQYVDNSTASQLQELTRREAPRTNTNVRSTPEPDNIIDRGIRDQKFFEENREQIREAWKNRRRNRG